MSFPVSFCPCPFVVDATESTLEAIESGKIKLTTENSGIFKENIDKGYFIKLIKDHYNTM